MPHIGDRIDVWDPFVRVFHWSLVAAYIVAWASAEALPVLHDQVGYFVTGLVVLRVIWGLVGTHHARFGAFVRGPTTTSAYLRAFAAGNPPDHLGHNPAGGWMVVLLLLALLGTAGSGILLAVAGDGFWEEVHEGAAGLSLLLVATHVSGVIVSSLVHGENLVKAMLTGYKRRSQTDV